MCRGGWRGGGGVWIFMCGGVVRGKVDRGLWVKW